MKCKIFCPAFGKSLIFLQLLKYNQKYKNRPYASGNQIVSINLGSICLGTSKTIQRFKSNFPDIKTLYINTIEVITMFKSNNNFQAC